MWTFLHLAASTTLPNIVLDGRWNCLYNDDCEHSLSTFLFNLLLLGGEGTSWHNLLVTSTLSWVWFPGTYWVCFQGWPLSSSEALFVLKSHTNYRCSGSLAWPKLKTAQGSWELGKCISSGDLRTRTGDPGKQNRLGRRGWSNGWGEGKTWDLLSANYVPVLTTASTDEGHAVSNTTAKLPLAYSHLELCFSKSCLFLFLFFHVSAQLMLSSYEVQTIYQNN
jgi:hypothetical protein